VARRVAYLSTTGLEEFFVYDELTYEPLRAHDVEVEAIPWRRRDVDWSVYDAVVVRSTWDYQQDVDAFLDVLQTIDARTVLLNPLAGQRWNVDKGYMIELEECGVPIVQTRVVDGLTAAEVEDAYARFEADEIVVKPTVSANADDTFRLPRGVDPSEAVAVLAARRSLIQPFVRSVVDEGEFSVFAFDGKVSHAILKTPAAGDFRVQEEHGGSLASIVPDDALREVSDRAFAALPDDLLYARVDFVRVDGGFALMEAELIEPSLYFNLDPASPARFAEALVRRLDRSSR